MPRYRLSFPVKVRCKVDAVGVLRFLFEFSYKLAFSAYIYIMRLKTVLYIYSES